MCPLSQSFISNQTAQSSTGPDMFTSSTPVSSSVFFPPSKLGSEVVEISNHGYPMWGTDSCAILEKLNEL